MVKWNKNPSGLLKVVGCVEEIGEPSRSTGFGIVNANYIINRMI